MKSKEPVKTKTKTVSRAKTKPKEPAVKKKVQAVVKDKIPKKEKENKKVFITHLKLAEFIGVDPSRLYQLRSQGIVTAEPKANGKTEALYDFVKSLHSIIKFYREKSDSRRSSESEDMANEKLKRVSIKRETEELKLHELKSDLHRTEDIERVMGAALTRLRINLRAIPMGVAPLIREKKNVNEIAEAILERIDRALNETATVNINKLLAEEEGAEPK